VLVPDPQQVPTGHPEPRTVRWRAPRRQSCGNDPPVRCKEKLNCFETCGASGRRFLSVAAAAYSAWGANIIDMVRPGGDYRGPRGVKDDENDKNADMEKDGGM